ncbi:related to Mrp8p [Saccharomycodes ludwigii]|uniref:Related to Mrp8p n=1 Tax=Saccharomycodes ludwigii TaxID=36035 RepID=A0A376B351_9ASCO|nr:hypothetical protein SCDLUD_004778 [Saccharomycodes ludwigii]KAH3899339.1 hypothetical protein SCDLUD_004778 [Saccharomycodes ludwigii]SSD59116.1 related to Mrp8p [Saccharomycodes ludwigii]
MSNNNEIEKLKRQIVELQDLVQRQNKVISKTGQSVLEMRVDMQKAAIRELPDINPNNLFSNFATAKSGTSTNSKFDPSDFVTNEDIVQLVGELQGQLDAIEERNIKRIVNSTKKDLKDYVAPLTNADGDNPVDLTDDKLFPKTVGDFKNMDNITLYQLAKFYELLPATVKDQQNFENFLEGKMQDFHITESLTKEQIEREIKNNFRSEEDLNDVFNDLARFLGLTLRRGTDAW